MSFQGSLDELPLADIVQLVAVAGKTGVFSLTRAGERGSVWLKNGQITHARLNDVEGEDAVFTLALWTNGTFQFSPGVESPLQTITRSNTNLLMEAARRSDEWKILSKRIATTESVPALVFRDRHGGPVTLTPQEWMVVTKIDGQRSIDEIARALRLSPFDTAKTLYGLVTAELVEIGRPRPASNPGLAPPAPMPAVTPSGQTVPVVTTVSGVFQAVTRGDEKRSLQILCTKVKQEAESAAGAAGHVEFERPYRAALAELDRGRGLDVVRELVRTLEEGVARLKGREGASIFRERMSPLL